MRALNCSGPSARLSSRPQVSVINRRLPSQLLARAAWDGANSEGSLAQISESTSPVPDILYRFIVPEYVTHFGQELRVVGSVPELGSWHVEAAPRMQWQEGHKWVLETRLPRTAFEYKVIVTSGNEVRWEQGVNRVVQADASLNAAPVELVINMVNVFNLTHLTSMELELSKGRIEESLELAKATLDLLEARRRKLGKAWDIQHDRQVRLMRQIIGTPTREQQRLAYELQETTDALQAEFAQLDAAVARQSSTVADLSSLLAIGNESEDGQRLLLALGNKLAIPRQVGSLSRAQADALSLASKRPATPALQQPEGPQSASAYAGELHVEQQQKQADAYQQQQQEYQPQQVPQQQQQQQAEQQGAQSQQQGVESQSQQEQGVEAHQQQESGSPSRLSPSPPPVWQPEDVIEAVIKEAEAEASPGADPRASIDPTNILADPALAPPAPSPASAPPPPPALESTEPVHATSPEAAAVPAAAAAAHSNGSAAAEQQEAVPEHASIETINASLNGNGTAAESSSVVPPPQREEVSSVAADSATASGVQPETGAQAAGDPVPATASTEPAVAPEPAPAVQASQDGAAQQPSPSAPPPAQEAPSQQAQPAQPVEVSASTQKEAPAPAPVAVAASSQQPAAAPAPTSAPGSNGSSDTTTPAAAAAAASGNGAAPTSTPVTAASDNRPEPARSPSPPPPGEAAPLPSPLVTASGELLFTAEMLRSVRIRFSPDYQKPLVSRRSGTTPIMSRRKGTTPASSRGFGGYRKNGGQQQQQQQQSRPATPPQQQAAPAQQQQQQQQAAASRSQQ